MDGYSFADIIDLSTVQSLIESFYATSGFMVTILAPDGAELVGVGWQDLCLKYHRRHPETARLCWSSNYTINDVHADGPLAEGNYQEFRWQVMENLLSNAAKFSEKGAPILVSGKNVGDFFQVSVTDRGVGISPEHVQQIFDKFYRADSSDSAAEGLGLGMAIVKNIIEAHGGEIWVTSEKGSGTTVSFNLPTKRNLLDPVAAEA